MKKHILTAGLIASVSAAAAGVIFAHCQIPCGIYGDSTRFDLMREHVATIRKSMVKINELSKAADRNLNQEVRWVSNKEQHAGELSEIITYYFMAQRVKPVEEKGKPRDKYITELTLLHRILVGAMKAKQTADTDYCDQLDKLITEFEKSYNDEKK